MKARYIVTKKEGKYSEGLFDILSDTNETLFSGTMHSGAKLASPNNKGYMPEGEYNIVSLRMTTEEPFTIDGYGWVAGLLPKFQTDRTNLALHPDGGFPGSAGCGVDTWTLDDSVKIHNLIAQGLEQKGFVPFTCMYVPTIPR